jgi:hypothetical protein
VFCNISKLQQLYYSGLGAEPGDDAENDDCQASSRETLEERLFDGRVGDSEWLTVDTNEVSLNFTGAES